MADPFAARLDVRLSDIDAQGHMTSAAYVAFANHALWACVRAAGVDVDALLASGVGPVNLETTIRYLRELRGGDKVDVSCRLAFGDGKTYQVDHELRETTGELAADVTCTFGLLDLKERRLVPDPASRWLQSRQSLCRGSGGARPSLAAASRDRWIGCTPEADVIEVHHLVAACREQRALRAERCSRRGGTSSAATDR